MARAVELTKGELNLAEDLVQQVYVKWWEVPPCGQTALELKHWFRTVLRNLFVDRERKRKLAGGIALEEYLTLAGECEAQLELRRQVEEDW